MNYYCFIAGYLTAILGFYVFIYAYNHFSGINIKITNREHIIILIVSIFMTINNLYNNIYLSVWGTIFLLSIFFFLISKDSFSKSLYLSNYICLISLITEFIISIVLSLIVSDINSVNNSPLIKTSFSIVYFWSFYFIYKIPIFKYLYKKTYEIFFNKKDIIFFVYCFLIMVGVMYAIYSINYENKQLYIFSLLIIVLFAIVIFNYFNEIHNNQILNIKNKYLMDNQIIFKNTLDDFRTLKHNLLNDFLFISSLCNNEIQEIINEKITKYHIVADNFNDLNNIPEGLQGIIYFKSSIARKKNIEFYIDINSDYKIKKINKRLYIDLCEIVGIVLDNAIEASSEANNKSVYCNILSGTDSVAIEILNTYSNDIDLDDIGNKNYSTKKRSSGLGLYHIQKLNKNIKVRKSIINDLFKIEIRTLK